MKFITTRVHGVIDYIMTVLLFAAPWIFGFNKGDFSTWTCITLGFIMLFLSLTTAYELGYTRIIPMRTHLVVDFLTGALLAASPWIFSFSEHVYLPHLILGLGEIMVSLVTRTVPTKEGRREVGFSRPMDVLNTK